MSLAKLPSYIREVNTTFEYLLEEYCSESSDITEEHSNHSNIRQT